MILHTLSRPKPKPDEFKIHGLRMRLGLMGSMAILFFLVACAKQTTTIPSKQPDREFNADKEIAAKVIANRFESAGVLAQQLIKKGNKREISIGHYWMGIVHLRMRQPDSALIEFQKVAEGFPGTIRAAQTEALVQSLETICESPRPEQVKKRRVESLERRSTELQKEVDRLLRENERYEKLLSDLDRMP